MRLVRILRACAITGVCAGLSAPAWLTTAPAGAAATPCADLQISDITVSPEQPIAGTAANISITITNAGTCTAGGFVTQFKESASAPTGPSASINSLGAGASQTIAVPYTFPRSGNFQAVVQTDTGNAVSETNEVNNLAIKSITVLSAGTDLTISNFNVEPNDPIASGAVVQGEMSTASITVENLGNTASGAFQVQWTPYLLARPISTLVPGLGAGASTTVQLTFTFPNAGTFNGRAVVDPDNRVVETNETNNRATFSTLVEPPLPNLTFRTDQGNQDNRAALVNPPGITISPGPSGTPSGLDVTIINNGNADAGHFLVSWQPGPGITPLTQQVNSLAEGVSTTIHFDYVFKTAGTYDGTVTLDSSHIVSEVNETDNTARTEFVISAAFVNLTITGARSDPPSPVQGAASTISITIQNLGNVASGDFVTSYNPDAFRILVPSAQTLTQQSGPLGPGASETITFNFTYPQAGNFRGVADVDAFNVIKESNESDNEAILNLAVQPAPIDLVFTTPLNFSPTQVVKGVPETVTTTVQNTGPIATGPFSVQFNPKTGGLPQSVHINGLNAGESRLVTFHTTYATKGTFTATATIDPNNQVNEAAPGGESNNVATQTVNVVPPSATLAVKIINETVYNDLDGGLAGDGEWSPQFFAVYDPSSTCNIDINVNQLHIQKTVKSVQCHNIGLPNDGSVDDHGGNGGNLNVNDTLNVTLEDSTPFVAVLAAFESDTLFPDFGGTATIQSTRPAYLSLPNPLTVQGKNCVSSGSVFGGGGPQSGGHCFDAHFSVTPSNVVGPTMATAATKRTAATQARTEGRFIRSQFTQLGATMAAAAKRAHRPLTALRVSARSA